MDINELRDLVRARHRAATSKVSRLRRSGVEIGGSEYDVRRNPSNIKRYNRTQLNNYLNQLNGFTARSTGYVQSANGPLPKADFMRYKQLERKETQRARAERQRYGDLKLPGQNNELTIAQREQLMRATRRAASGDADNRVYREKDRRPSQINGPDALRKLIAQQEERLSRKFKPVQISKQRQNFRAMLDYFGDPDMLEMEKGLTDEQFNVLWNYTPVPRDAGRSYHVKAMVGIGAADANQARMMDDNAADLKEALTWAQFLPTRGRKK